MTLPEIAEEFDLDEDEALDQLQEKERVASMEVGESWVFW